jgi:glycosyltransferase involved in cell wall biosynthesis
MPCLNEAKGVGTCVKKAVRTLEEMGLLGEVVVADNGSSDGSREIASRAGARVVVEERRGYGSAYLRGFAEATGRVLVMGDADDTYDFTDLPRFVDPLLNDECDLVIGSRLKGKIMPGAMPWSHRWVGNPILSGMLKLLFHTSVSDSHCGMRAFTREAYERMHLQTTGMEFASEMVVNSLRAGLRIREVPITYRRRIGESKLSGVRDAWRHVRFMLMFSPSYLFFVPGAVLLVCGALLVLLLAGGPREAFGRVWDYHSLLLGAAGVTLGYNLMLFDTFAKAYSIGAGFAPPGKWLRLRSRLFTLERGLVVGAFLVLAGLGLEIKIVLDWLAAGQGAMMAVRGAVIGMTAMTLGVQTIFGSFLTSLLLIQKR